MKVLLYDCIHGSVLLSALWAETYASSDPGPLTSVFILLIQEKLYILNK